MDTTLICLGAETFSCVLASTPTELSRGLSKHANLNENEGMLFVFPSIGDHTFAMKSCAFPIDIIGIGEDSKVTRIVASAQPGSKEHWTFPSVSMVLEVPGGTCARLSVSEGFEVTAMDENAEEYFDEVLGEENVEHMKNAGEKCGHCGRDDEAKNFFGSADKRFHKSCMSRGPFSKKEASTHVAQIVDEQKFVEKVANILFSHAGSINWTPDVLNGGATERAVVSRRELAKWLTDGKAEDGSTTNILNAASSDRGLNLVGDSFILAGMADIARIGYAGKSPTLMLYREAK